MIELCWEISQIQFANVKLKVFILSSVIFLKFWIRNFKEENSWKTGRKLFVNHLKTPHCKHLRAKLYWSGHISAHLCVWVNYSFFQWNQRENQNTKIHTPIETPSNLLVCARSIAHLSHINENENKPKIIVKDEKYCCKLNESNSRSKFMRWGWGGTLSSSRRTFIYPSESWTSVEKFQVNICWLSIS